MAFLSFAKNLFVPPAVYGVGDIHPIRTLQDALSISSHTDRNTVALVNSGLAGGDIDRVIGSLASTVRGAGKNAVLLSSEAQLNEHCRSTLRGVTKCYGAVVFRASPNEGSGVIWNYTIRSDGALGAGRINVDKDTNDGEVYILPLQRAVDYAITSLNSSLTTDQPALPNDLQEYPFTGLTQEERADRIRINYQHAITSFMGVGFILGIIGVCYHMAGFIATERESGMSTLVEAMMPTRRSWEAQVARLLSYHVSFTLLYLPGWIIGSIILRSAVFSHTNMGIVLVYHILAGLALTSMTILGASIFKRSQLSGVTVTIAFILLAIIAQVITSPNSAAVAVLSVLFAPCNYVYFITLMARFERESWPTDLAKTAPSSPWAIPGIALWVFLIIQIFAYAVLGAYIERYMFGTSTHGRTIVYGPNDGDENSHTAAVTLEGFTKTYAPSLLRRMFGFISKPKDPVLAVNGLSLTATRGQILALLGANGSGKSTTLDAIAGTNKLTSGKITIDGTGGLGIAPQKNVLWDELTVEEHVTIFNRLKSPKNVASKEEIRELISSIDLDRKIDARSKTLSGGQKRKLQLGMMLTGGSAVCCVDEVSSGIDPLSRRKIWDILLSERGRRTIIMTTHFLDEADLLSDHIAILSKGTLRAQGSSVELKDRLGGGYRIHVYDTPRDVGATPDVDGVKKKVSFDVVTYLAPSSSLAAEVIRVLEKFGFRDYRFSNPTIEDVFLQLAEEIRGEENMLGLEDASAGTEIGHSEKQPSEDVVGVDGSDKDGLELLPGKRIGYIRQAAVLFLKRITILKSNWFPYAAAFLTPIIAAGLTTLFIKGQQPVGCNPGEQGSEETAESIFTADLGLYIVAGPTSKLSNQTLQRLFVPLFEGLGGSSSGSNNDSSGLLGLANSFLSNFTGVDSFDEFKRLVIQERKDVSPAGLWLGDATSEPTLAWKGNVAEVYSALFGMNFFDILLTNTTIGATFAAFDIPWTPNTGKSLQLLVYMGLAFSAYPGFFALYPNLERRRNVRGLEYSNGVRPLPLWIAYAAFDFAIVIVAAALVTILFAALSEVWYHVGYLFLIFMLYGLASILLAYVVSLFCRNQLSAYAFVAAGQAVMFLIYLIGYLCTITYAPVNKVDDYLIMVHFLVAAFAPIGSIVRTLFLALNLFSVACTGTQLSTTPGGILQYGGPILYLVLQSVILFILLLWLDSGDVGGWLRRLFRKAVRPRAAPEDPVVSDEEVANELVRVTTSGRGDGTSSTDGLRVMHLTKTFGKNTVVDNVTFGIKRGEVFALLGPNGAGKSTTISLVRGDIKPSGRGGEILVEDISVTKHLATARSHLGVCPQFDAVDQMTVREHLRFYARIRGIPDIEHNVQAILRAVGLTAFADRQASALSGGNKRKLSLGIALMGNPTVVLLDEPSSGLDAAAKRIMWRTLAAVVPGRSILLTTHSMEEADALAGRAGILAKRMLAMGTTEQLRARFGDALHVHLVCKGAPHTPKEDMLRVLAWVAREFPGAEVEEKTYHGQMRFSVPAAEVLARFADETAAAEKKVAYSGGALMDEKKGCSSSSSLLPSSPPSSQSAVGQLVVILEERRKELGIEHFSVSPTTLDQVFLTIVGRHNVQEENYGENKDGQKKKMKVWKCGL
ncbi:p-loop containing nucleoside triphosphate hydrolase protein [Pleurostoma richardsiae]|uniref:P-loop containing nucleoside triphosphate hydrolase protein n=1 Tax=Pleurostoma richardsiae TaxID=41990 RepID=A0AA38VHD5_9PEZI|nr:p-loop containing nucleoside triphosphate hydrolase protein [Pleurostoma richardsiae]